MPDCLHSIEINADPLTVFEAISTQSGVQHWWTEDCDVSGREGTLNTLWFNGRTKYYTMEAQKLLPSQRIFWVCIDGPNEWKNTQLWWEIRQITPQLCLVEFKHMNWRDDQGSFASCNSTWGALMYGLKRYCETRQLTLLTV